MQDRPTFDELLAAVERFLDDEIVPNVPGSRGFHGRVAANALRIIRRELENEDEQLAAEWEGLDGILGPETPPLRRAELRVALRARNEALCSLVRGGSADEGENSGRIYTHVRDTVRAKLIVTNPDLISRSEASD